MPLTRKEQNQVEKIVEEELGQLRENLSAVIDMEEEIKEAADAGEAVTDKMEKIASRSKENAEMVDTIQEKIHDFKEEMTERQDEFEAKISGSAGPGEDYSGVWVPGKSLASKVEEKGLSSNDQDKVVAKFETWNWRAWRQLQRSKEITPATASGGDLTDRDTIPGILGPGERTLTIRDLLPTNTTNTDLVRYVEENTVTDSAGPQDVSAGSKKGESDFTFDDAQEPVETLAHWVKVSTQLLDDVNRLRNYLNNRMRFLLLQEEEDQLLLGDGTGNNLNGVQTQADSYSSADETSVQNPTNVDRLRLAMNQVRLQEFPPTAFVLHPTDWAQIELEKDANDMYVFARPQDAAGPRMWGLPVVATTAQTEDKFLVGSFNLGAEIHDRQEARVAISTEDDTNFQENKATIRAEERIALTVYRPSSFVTGDLNLS